MAHSARAWWPRANVRPSPSPSSLSVLRMICSASSVLPSISRARPIRSRSAAGPVAARRTRAARRGRRRRWIRRRGRPDGGCRHAAGAARGTLDGRAEAGQQAEHRTWLDRLGDRLRQALHHQRRPLMAAGVEDEADRFKDASALHHVVGQRAGDRRIDRCAADRSGVAELERSGDLAAQRDPRRDGVVDERRPAQPVEHRPVDPRRTSQRATTERAGASSWCSAASLAARTMRDAIATASDAGSRAAWSSDVAMARMQPSDASASRSARGRRSRRRPRGSPAPRPTTPRCR